MAVTRFFGVCFVGIVLLAPQLAEGVKDSFETKRGQFPWLVSIVVTNYQYYEAHICGGTLIAPQWVVTAAHCLDSESESPLAVRVGVYNRANGNLVYEKEGELINATYRIQHPYYEPGRKPYVNDIGLIKLAQPANVSPGQIASIPRRPIGNNLASCVEVGWGATGEGQRGSNTPRYTVVPLLSNDVCVRAYGAIDANSVCAGRDGSGSCVGDNGGPVVCKSASGEVLGAIMSWRSGCAATNRPAVYVDVSRYLGWLRQTTGIQSL